MSGKQFLGALDWQVGDDIGARRRRPHHGGHGGYHGGNPSMNRYHAAQQRANMAAQFALPDVPGVPGRDAALLPAAWPVTTFALASGTNIQAQTMSPQAPFRGQRLVCVVIRNGTSAGVTAPLINYLQVGMKPIITTSNGIPAEMFTANAFDTNLLFPPTVPGVIYTLGLSLAVALTSTDTLIVLASVNGSAVL